MKPQKTIQRAFYVLLCLFCFSHAQSQQKIQIKDGTKDVGHFSVELSHNLPGSPMKAFSGNGGAIEVKAEQNSFILRMQNFVWYDMDEEVELIFNTKEIETRSDAKVTMNQENSRVTLKPLSSYIREIYFSVDGYGKVKLSVPFKFIGGESQFFQEFEITPYVLPGQKKTQVQEKKLSSKDIKKIWKEVDRSDRKQVESFLASYGEEKAAKRYVKIANRAIEDLDAKDLLKREEARIQGKKVKEEIVSNSVNDVEGEQLDSEKLVNDVNAIVDSLNFSEQVVEELRLYNLTLIHGDNADILEIAEKEMPLQLNLKEVGEQQMALINAVPIPAFSKDSVVEINTDLLKKNHIKGIFNSFDLVNAQGIELFTSPIILDNKPAGQSLTRYLIYGLGLLLLGFGLFVFINKRSKEKKQAETKKVFKQKMEENRKSQEVQEKAEVGKQVVHQVVAGAPKKNKIVIGQKVTDRKKEDLVPSHSVARKSSGSSRFKITKKKKAGNSIDYGEFVALVNAQKTVNVDLSKVWSDSTIHNVYLAPKFIKELDNFLAESSNEGIQNELQGAVPEVGGFLMGRFSKPENSLQVFVEKFVPFVPEYNDVFKIEIGTKTIVDELGDAQDKNPQLEVIGWFHTHPGHGLFLSTSDLSVQRHFPADYQVAMEIDSLTKGLDMSFFTRQSTGKMNNSQDRKPGVGWFQWVDIENSNLT